MKQRVFILGAGRFGVHLATRLSEFGWETILADLDGKRVAELADQGFQAVELDAADEHALRESGAAEADTVVVAIGENLQASVLATVQLRELQVKRLVARAVAVSHARVLEKLGAHLVVLPTRDTAYALAERLRTRRLSERIPIGESHQLAEIKAGPSLAGVSLRDARLPERFSITIVLVQRPVKDGENQDLEPTPDLILAAGDSLAVTGRRETIDQFERECGA
jgi:trk system potassium uptake protein TrkA